MINPSCICAIANNEGNSVAFCNTSNASMAVLGSATILPCNLGIFHGMTVEDNTFDLLSWGHLFTLP